MWEAANRREAATTRYCWPTRLLRHLHDGYMTGSAWVRLLHAAAIWLQGRHHVMPSTMLSRPRRYTQQSEGEALDPKDIRHISIE